MRALDFEVDAHANSTAILFLGYIWVFGGGKIPENRRGGYCQICRVKYLVRMKIDFDLRKFPQGKFWLCCWDQLVMMVWQLIISVLWNYLRKLKLLKCSALETFIVSISNKYDWIIGNNSELIPPVQISSLK